MVAIDTNILVYAHREDTEWHDRALARLLELAQSNDRWAIPWPCVHEFISVTTRERYFDPPSTLAQALAALEVWMQSPGLLLLHEGPGYFEKLSKLCTEGRVKGPMVHDARIAAICLNSGVAELWTCDRDFSRFSALRTVNPLANSPS